MKILPVIHHLNEKTTLSNASIAFAENCYGVFLISMDGHDEPLIPLAIRLKRLYPEKIIGINHLTLSALESLNAVLKAGLDATWTDKPGISSQNLSNQAKLCQSLLQKNPLHQFYASVAFKYQPKELNPVLAAQHALSLNMIPTTSGEATGVAAEVMKIRKMRENIGQEPLALASGLTPENIKQYRGLITHGLVSTGISEDFYHFSSHLLKKMMNQLEE